MASKDGTTSLHLVIQVTVGLYDVVKQAPQLKLLHLSYVRVTREALESYAQGGAAKKLGELSINGVEVTPGSLISLGTYTGLTALGLTNLHQAFPTSPITRCSIHSPKLAQIWVGLCGHIADVRALWVSM